MFLHIWETISVEHNLKGQSRKIAWVGYLLIKEFVISLTGGLKDILLQDTESVSLFHSTYWFSACFELC